VRIFTIEILKLAGITCYLEANYLQLENNNKENGKGLAIDDFCMELDWNHCLDYCSEFVGMGIS